MHEAKVEAAEQTASCRRRNLPKVQVKPPAKRKVQVSRPSRPCLAKVRFTLTHPNPRSQPRQKAPPGCGFPETQKSSTATFRGSSRRNQQVFRTVFRTFPYLFTCTWPARFFDSLPPLSAPFSLFHFPSNLAFALPASLFPSLVCPKFPFGPLLALLSNDYSDSYQKDRVSFPSAFSHLTQYYFVYSS